MTGDADVIELLNAVLTSELTAINQYFIHYKMCANWGFAEIAEKKRSESIEEMKHADEVIERILFLDGVPNMQRLSSVRVGENVEEMHRLDLTLEIEARTRLVDGIALCRDKKDEGTRMLLEHILEQEEEGIDWLETQLHVIGEIGIKQYLAEKL